MKAYLRDLSEQLKNHFSKKELKVLCFQLGYRWDDIEDGAYSITIINLLNYCVRRSDLSSLIDQCIKERPNVVWNYPDIEADGHSKSSDTLMDGGFDNPLFGAVIDAVEKEQSEEHAFGVLLHLYRALREQKISEEDFASAVVALLNRGEIMVGVARQFLVVIGYDVLQVDQSYILVKENKNEQDC